LLKLKLKLWLVTLVVALSSAPAWALPSRGGTSLGKQKSERNDSSIRLTTTKGAGLSFWSQRLVDAFPAFPNHSGSKSKKLHATLPWRGPGPTVINPVVQGTVPGTVPMPEPSALMCFGVGILMARGAIGRTRRSR